MQDSMNLKKNKASFLSSAASQICFPCGPPRTMVVGTGAQERVVTSGAPIVEFSLHKYETEDRQIAIGLISDEDNFGMPGGWDIDAACLPREVAVLYGNLSPSAKRAVVGALVEGKKTKEALESADSDEVGNAKKAVDSASPSYRLRCPVCDLGIGGESVSVSEAQKIMSQHVRMSHPEFKGSKG